VILFRQPRALIPYVRTVWETDLRVIVVDLDRKPVSASTIHNDIVAMLGSNLVGYSIITRYVREAKSPFSTEEASDASDRKPIDDIDEAIMSAVNESRFASVQRL
jgi:hypothetical protein